MWRALRCVMQLLWLAGCVADASESDDDKVLGDPSGDPTAEEPVPSRAHVTYSEGFVRFDTGAGLVALSLEDDGDEIIGAGDAFVFELPNGERFVAVLSRPDDPSYTDDGAPIDALLDLSDAVGQYEDAFASIATAASAGELLGPSSAGFETRSCAADVFARVLFGNDTRDLVAGSLATGLAVSGGGSATAVLLGASTTLVVAATAAPLVVAGLAIAGLIAAYVHVECRGAPGDSIRFHAGGVARRMKLFGGEEIRVDGANGSAVEYTFSVERGRLLEQLDGYTAVGAVMRVTAGIVETRNVTISLPLPLGHEDGSFVLASSPTDQRGFQEHAAVVNADRIEAQAPAFQLERQDLLFLERQD